MSKWCWIYWLRLTTNISKISAKLHAAQLQLKRWWQPVTTPTQMWLTICKGCVVCLRHGKRSLLQDLKLAKLNQSEDAKGLAATCEERDLLEQSGCLEQRDQLEQALVITKE